MGANRQALRNMYTRGEYGTGESNRAPIQISLTLDVYDLLADTVPVGKGGLASATITLALELLLGVVNFDSSPREVARLRDMAGRLFKVCSRPGMASFALALVAHKFEQEDVFSATIRIPEDDRGRILEEF